MGKASTAWLNSILGVDGFGKISRSRLWPQPADYFACGYLFCAMAPPPTEPLAFSLINSSAVKRNDLARLYGAVPIGERARLDRENDQLFIFIDGVSAEQCNAADNNGLVLLGGSRSFRERRRSTGRISQSPQPITRGSDLVARLKEGLHQGFHVVRIHMIGIRSPGGVLLSRR